MARQPGGTGIPVKSRVEGAALARSVGHRRFACRGGSSSCVRRRDRAPRERRTHIPPCRARRPPTGRHRRRRGSRPWFRAPFRFRMRERLGEGGRAQEPHRLHGQIDAAIAAERRDLGEKVSPCSSHLSSRPMPSEIPDCARRRRTDENASSPPKDLEADRLWRQTLPTTSAFAGSVRSREIVRADIIESSPLPPRKRRESGDPGEALRSMHLRVLDARFRGQSDC